ncbi:MAG: DUF1553 domain-containing protein [Planctomycetota bacterium]|nr:DUF1553 domain-containing protein [Planctomycetota bacterium]
MMRTLIFSLVSLFFLVSTLRAQTIDSLISSENHSLGVTQSSVGLVDDLAFIRRVSVDLIGRIPTLRELKEYQSWPVAQRRNQLVEKLIEHPRFADRWTVFFADLLRLRSNITGGSALIAHVHRGIREDLPYNELAASLIATNGKAGRSPEVGFILGDNVDPLAMASVTAQVFMGVRIGCAQCHDHPFDVWTRKDFYGVAAYFGKTQRFESNFTRVVYTTEGERTTVFWPPEDEAEETERKPLAPSFPFPLIDSKKTPDFIARYQALMQQKADALAAKDSSPSLDDLLAQADDKLEAATGGAVDLAIAEAKNEISKIDVKASLYKQSVYRETLAKQITSPRNRLFAESFVNRIWRNLVGRGFVEPVDDFREDNPPSHPKTLAFIADEFVANGYNFKQLVKSIVLSDVYQQKQVPLGLNELEQEELEAAFLATPMRRMLSEALYDSIVTAGHLFDVKYRAGENNKTIEQEVRVLLASSEPEPNLAADLQGLSGNSSQMTQPAMAMNPGKGTGYKLEDGIELDFDALLEDKEEIELDRMVAKSQAELEAERMQMEKRQRPRSGMKYETKVVQRTIDDNPRFSSALRMATPAPIGHFVRIFGQTSRNDLGEARDDNPSMRQSLMMLNGRLTLEASRVGTLEPINQYLNPEKPQLDQAIQLAYHEILTRNPSAIELAWAKEIIREANSLKKGMADLRWVMLNSNEFRFLP